MGGILSFSASTLDALIDDLGLRTTWLRMLVTRLQGDSRFEYVLESSALAGFLPLEDDLLGGLSIGEIGVLYEYTLARTDREGRRNNGQYFTPDDVARFMASHSAGFPRGVWLDPCSGVGNLTWHLAEAQENPEDFLLHEMLIADRDGLALLIARVMLTWRFQKRVSDFFHQVEDRFIEQDFLSVSENPTPDLLSNFSSLDAIPKHDYVIMNPPYVSGVRDSRFETSEAGDLYSYFLENSAKTSEGIIAITPQSFTNAKKFQSLRALLLRRFSGLTIYAFDNVPANVFRGIKFGSTNSNKVNSTRAAIVVASNFAHSRKITGLTRWRSSERDRLFREIPNLLSEVEFSSDYFPKVMADEVEMYRSLVRMPALRERTSQQKTIYSLNIPSSPRYFISALKTPVKRSSQKEVFFRTVEERDFAYLLLNSSLMYWWWRVRDGGMTLSNETLLSLPVPSFSVDSDLILALELSESENKVYKQNGGEPQENVKHPIELVARLNNLVLPSFSQQLLQSHRNSQFS